MPDFSAHALAVLELLRDRHNVLVSGPPGTGKSRLLSEIAAAFVGRTPVGAVHVPGQAVAIPNDPPMLNELQDKLPSISRKQRKVFRTVFHQNSKYREFISGMTPAITPDTPSTGTRFRVVAGTLYRASEFAKSAEGAALLIIDEINRGPAVQVFGGSIVAIESDKRLAPDGALRAETQLFEIMSPETGESVEYALPHHLYILAAMNQADSSVEALDVAFLRRWTPYRLDPDETVLRGFFGLGVSEATALPETATGPAEVFEAAVRAWSSVNGRIRLGRGGEFQVGHGVLMGCGTPDGTVEGALRIAAETWRLMRAHVDEVFFGDLRGVSTVLNVGVPGHVYSLEDASFGEEPRLELSGPASVGPDAIYQLLRAVAA